MQPELIGFSYRHGEYSLLCWSEYLNAIQDNFRIETMAVQWFSQLISGLLLLIPGFDSTLVIVISVVDRLALRQIFVRVFHFSTYE
jgi:hypothetical protein